MQISQVQICIGPSEEGQVTPAHVIVLCDEYLELREPDSFMMVVRHACPVIQREILS